MTRGFSSFNYVSFSLLTVVLNMKGIRSCDLRQYEQKQKQKLKSNNSVAASTRRRELNSVATLHGSGYEQISPRQCISDRTQKLLHPLLAPSARAC